MPENSAAVAAALAFGHICVDSGKMLCGSLNALRYVNNLEAVADAIQRLWSLFKAIFDIRSWDMRTMESLCQTCKHVVRTLKSEVIKVEKMKEIAKQKAKEERKRLESELKLKLTKQGHFLLEEDNKFLERIRVTVEEEERQLMVAAKDAISNALNSEDIISVKDDKDNKVIK
ncbi:hypothetical protein LXL04_034173 [Taraxacum kok-saghyz]